MGDATQKFHSAIRWGKPIGDLEPLLGNCLEAKDEKNGNVAIHIAAQNGHIEITKWLVGEKGANVNAQNGKGNTALHMSMGYDFYEQSAYLINEAKADGSIENSDGNKAIEGIDGDKTGGNAWGGPMCLLNQIKDKDTMESAFSALEACDTEMIDKAILVQTGMKLKKSISGWDQARFMAIAKRA